MSLPFENALQRERERQRRQRKGGQHTDLSARMDTPTLSPAGVGSPSAPPPSLDLSSMTDMATELTRPVDRAQLDQEIEDFNLTYPVNVDDAVNLFSLPPVQALAPPRPPPNPSLPPPKHDPSRPPEHAPSPPPLPADLDPSRAPEHVPSPPCQRPLTARRSAGAGTRTTTSTVTTPSGRPRIAAKQPGRRPRVLSTPSPDSSPPPSDDDGDDDDEDRRRGLRRRLDLLKEDAH